MLLRHNTTTEIDFFMPDNADPWTGKTGLTGITVQYKKQGQSAFTTLSSPTITETGNGWYKVSVPTAMVDTLGFLVVRFSVTGAKTQQQLYQVVAYNPYDSNLGMPNLDAAVSSRMAAGNVTVGGYASGQDPATLVWGYVVEASQSALHWMRLMGAALFNKRSVSGQTETYRDWNDSKNRVVGTVDSNGNRTITTRDGS